MIFNVNSGAGKIPVNVLPEFSGSFTYDGSVKTPVWQNFDETQLTIGGITSAVDAGTYTVYFTPRSDYEWYDGTATPKEATWSIAKAAGAVTLSASSGIITGKYDSTVEFTVERSGDGEISVRSGNTSVAEVAVSGTTVTVTSKGYGTASITVSVAEGSNHTAAADEIYTVTVDYLYVIKNGVKNEDIAETLTNAKTSQVDDTYELRSNGATSSFSACFGKMDLTDYKKLCIDVAGGRVWGDSTIPAMYFSSTVTAKPSSNYKYFWSGGRGSTMVTLAAGSHQLDLSAVTGNYYVCFRADTSEAYGGYMRVSDFWLE